MAMPVMVLALFNAAQISRFMRAAVLDNLTQDYVRTARAKGALAGLAISLTVLSVNYIGDGLRDALDPRLRGAHGLRAGA